MAKIAKSHLKQHKIMLT